MTHQGMRGPNRHPSEAGCTGEGRLLRGGWSFAAALLLGFPVVMAAAPASAIPTAYETTESILGTTPPSISHDVNSDGVVDAADVVSAWEVEVRTILLPGDVPLDLIRIPAGSFLMGSPLRERGREPTEDQVHLVTFAEDYYLGRTEVTQGQWLAVMGSWPDPTQLPGTPGYPNDVGDDHPAYFVSWDDAQRFVAALNAHIASSGQGPLAVRLPSEAEWEYACRAGTQTRFFFGDSLSVDDVCEDGPAGGLPGNRSEYAWYCGNDAPFGSKPVGTRRANAFGLQDMSGNVWEWCQDAWHATYFLAPYDGRAWESASAPARVCRGGGYGFSLRHCRSAARKKVAGGFRAGYIGFRLAAPAFYPVPTPEPPPLPTPTPPPERITFVNAYGGSGLDQAVSVRPVSDGGYILAGETNSFDAGWGDAWLVKTNRRGMESWTRAFGGGQQDHAFSAHQTADGGYIVGANTRSRGAGNGDAWLIRTDENGNEVWSRTFGGADLDRAHFLHPTADGGYILGGSTYSYDAENGDAWLIKTDENGIEEWTRTFGGAGRDYGFAAQQTSDGGYILVGSTTSFSPEGGDAWLIKTNRDGHEIWSRTFTFGPLFLDEELASVQATADGGYILAGTTWANWYSGKAWLIKTDPAGREVWNQAFGDSRNPAGAVMGHEATCATQTPEGGYVLSGYSWAFSTAGFTYNPYGWLIKTDEAGNLIGTRTFDASYSPGVPACSVVSSVLATADGGYVLSGQTISSGAGSGDAWLAKTDSNGYVE